MDCSTPGFQVLHHLPELAQTHIHCVGHVSWVCSNSCPLSWCCHPAISSSVTPFFFCPQSFPEPWSFPMSQLFASGGQSTEPSASASVFSMSIQGWFPLGLTGSISSLPKGLWRVFFSTTVQKHPCGICDIKKRSLSALRVTWRRKKFLGAYFTRALLIYWQRFSPWPKPSQALLSPSDTKEHVCPEDDVQKRPITHSHVFSHVSPVQRVTAAPSGRSGSDKDAALRWNARRLLWVSYHQAPTWAHTEKTWTKTDIISNSSRLHPLGTLGPSKCLPQKLKADWRTDYGFQRPLRTGSQLLASVWREAW